MQGNGIKIGLIASVAVAVCLSLGMAFESMGLIGGGGGFSDDSKIWIKCINPDCNQAYSVTREEFSQMQGDNPMAMMPMTQGPPAFKCLKCGQDTAYMAQQCEKCKDVFFNGEAGDEMYPDKCPKCGYSFLEEAVKKQQ
jgi:ribosomal protein L40E